MRWFIAFLVVANVILFFWVKQQTAPSRDMSAVPPPDVGRLRLLTEMAEESAEAAEKGSSGPGVREPDETREAASVDAGVPSPQAEPGAAYPVTEGAVPAGPTPPAHTSADEEVDGFIAAVEQSIAQAEQAAEEGAYDESGTQGTPIRGAIREQADVPPAAAAGGAAEVVPEEVVGTDADSGLASASDHPGADTGSTEFDTNRVDQQITASEAVNGGSDTGVVTSLAEGAGSRCFRVGPFESKDADRLISRLPADVELLSDNSEPFASVDRYYVLIPPLPSRAEGRRKLRELADAGFTDTWLFPSGEYRNAISMGFFSRESGAQRHAANIAKKGFNAEVRAKTTLRQKRWLILKSTDAERDDLGLQLSKGSGVEPRDCP